MAKSDEFNEMRKVDRMVAAASVEALQFAQVGIKSKVVAEDVKTAAKIIEACRALDTDARTFIIGRIEAVVDAKLAAPSATPAEGDTMAHEDTPRA